MTFRKRSINVGGSVLQGHRFEFLVAHFGGCVQAGLRKAPRLSRGSRSGDASSGCGSGGPSGGRPAAMFCARSISSSCRGCSKSASGFLSPVASARASGRNGPVCCRSRRWGESACRAAAVKNFDHS